MTEDLGMIACRAMDKAWSLPAYESWQAVADAVVAAHEARRWRSIETAPKDGAILAWSPERSMVFQVVWRMENNDWSFIGRDGVSRMEYSHWTPIPAPPQEAREAFPIPDTLPEAPETREASQPTAAEVIAACEKHISDTLEGMPDKIDPRMKYREFQYHDYELDEMRKLLDLCAQWKEANHAK